MAISDRIAVINAGRVEQVDTPFALYARPRTRFAAEFIGRTNLIEGRRRAAALEFEGFSIPCAGGAEGSVLASVRPQSLRLSHRNGAAAPEEPDVVHLPARIGERVFLGERWDYGLTVESGGPPLRAAAPPDPKSTRLDSRPECAPRLPAYA